MNTNLPAWIVERPIAHRGLHDLSRGVAENSIAAFEAAAGAGFPAELDVRVTRDGAAVVFHDRALERLTGAEGNVGDAELSKIVRLRLSGTPHTVPSLSDVFEAVSGRIPLLVEVKNEGVAGEVEEATLEAIDVYNGEVAVQSFNPLTLQWFARNAPDLTRGLLSGGFEEDDMNPMLREKLRNLEMTDIAEPHFVGYDVRLLPFDPVTRMRRSGVPVLGWTVRSPRAEAEARRHCDNVIFEGYVPSDSDGDEE